MASIVKNLGYGEGKDIDVNKLANIIDKAFEQYHVRKVRQKTSFSPSGFYQSGTCPRRWYISFDGGLYVENFDPVSVGNMSNGHAAHDRLQEMLSNSDLDIVDIEQELLHDDPPIRGFIDMIVARGDQEVIVEIKTTRTEAFRARQAKMEPPDYQLIQILIYMYLKGTKSGFFLYEDKNDHSLLIIPVYMDEENTRIVENALEWMRTVRSAWEEQTLPEIPFRSNSRICKSCPLRTDCFDEERYGPGEVFIEPLSM